MKPQQLSALLNISGTTLRHWAGKEFAEFLSPSAAGSGGAKRSFNDIDARILAWVALMKAQNTSMADILSTLRAARSDGWRNLPELPGGMAGDEPIAVVPREAVEERVRALEERTKLQVVALEQERDRLNAQVVELKTENSELRQRLNAVTDQLLDLNRQLASMLMERDRRK